jgi:hypothetical protein
LPHGSCAGWLTPRLGELPKPKPGHKLWFVPLEEPDVYM